MKCPECTDEMEKLAPTFYWCHGCNWKGQIMSEDELMRALNISMKYAGDPQRVTDEIQNEFSDSNKRS